MHYHNARLRRHFPGSYPKKARIITRSVADSQGRTKFLTASEYRVRGRDEASKGFQPLAHLTIPLRRLGPRDGCSRYYRYFVAWAIQHLGL